MSGGVIGGLDKLFLTGVEGHVLPDTGIPELAFTAFQCMFSVVTPAIISGAVTERLRFSAFVIFALIWAVCIYNPMAHWVWGGGFLAQLGALDFAGGLVIHVLAGASALIFCILLGRRKGYGRMSMLPHHLPMTVLGASMLWFGWFGFNAGSALGVGNLAANALLATQTAAAAGIVSWVLVEWFHHGKPTVFGAASGCVAGLVSITPGSGFVGPMSAIVIGLIGAGICYLFVAVLKEKLGYDDSLDAFGIHGVGGTWGAVATGIWASTAINPAGADGLLYGGTHTFFAELLSVAAAYALGIVGTVAIYKLISLFMEMRVDEESEEVGVDISEHGEGAYNQSAFRAHGLKSGSANPFM